MRLRQRMKVDLPHPEGPMMAVTCRFRIGGVMPLSTSGPPKRAKRATARIFSTGSPAGSGAADRGASDPGASGPDASDHGAAGSAAFDHGATRGADHVAADPGV